MTDYCKILDDDSAHGCGVSIEHGLTDRDMEAFVNAICEIIEERDLNAECFGVMKCGRSLKITVIDTNDWECEKD